MGNTANVSTTTVTWGGGVYYPNSMNSEHINHLYREVSRLRDRLDQMEQAMSVTQNDLDQLGLALTTYRETVLAELDNLEAQIVQLDNNNGSVADLDLTNLRDIVASLPTVPDGGVDSPTTTAIPPTDTLSTDPTVGDSTTSPADPNAIPVVTPDPVPVDEGPTGA